MGDTCSNKAVTVCGPGRRCIMQNKAIRSDTTMELIHLLREQETIRSGVCTGERTPTTLLFSEAKHPFILIHLLRIEFCSSLVQSQPLLDYENICKHHFSLGCPVYDGDSWWCAKVLTNCSGDKLNQYHCVHNSTGHPFQVMHICAPISRCVKGTIPIYNKGKDVISCEPCPEGYYQPHDAWSDEAPECLERHACEEEGHKIECDMGTGSSNTQDVYCRCDARKGYVLPHFELRGMCVQWEFASCDLYPCPGGQERLLNYSCAPLCPQGQERDENDVCVSISLMNLTTTPVIDNRTMSGKATPRTTVETTLTTTVTPEQSPTDNSIALKVAVIALAVILVVLLIIVTS
ncbi:hypothetical protein ACJMK2_037750 [Sinanodonta woodiana]|uniref:Uncharacterized protein n=1 Tax=Sinanodonta woodiana TaxID=1069815 RepID=A0ABD3WN92_SINWO